MTREQQQVRLNELYTNVANLKGRLHDTDYVVIRAQEQKQALPADFKSQRQGWRDEINAAEAEIAQLEAEEVEQNAN